MPAGSANMWQNITPRLVRTEHLSPGSLGPPTSVHYGRTPSQYDPDEILEFICYQFTSCMRGVLVAQRVILISPYFKLTNMKNHLGESFQAEEQTAPDFFRPIFLAFIPLQ